ncbi:MAG: hypothetical protein C0412_07485 [Flavobacterium sp.]|nr:hypothetical protein [Flavobacterium sp.]
MKRKLLTGLVSLFFLFPQFSFGNEPIRKNSWVTESIGSLGAPISMKLFSSPIETERIRKKFESMTKKNGLQIISSEAKRNLDVSIGEINFQHIPFRDTISAITLLVDINVSFGFEVSEDLHSISLHNGTIGSFLNSILREKDLVGILIQKRLFVFKSGYSKICKKDITPSIFKSRFLPYFVKLKIVHE